MTAAATIKLAQRIRAAVERELERIDAAYAGPGQSADADAARTLAVLARTLGALDALEASAPGTPEEDDTRDLDEFRRELTRRLAAIHARRAG
jgi:hypothetical protein